MYRGDYFRGDYRRGDPGLFGFLGGFAKKALGIVPVVGPALAAGASVALPAILHKRQQQIASGALQPNVLGRALMKAHVTAPIGGSLQGTPHGRMLTSGGPMAIGAGAGRGHIQVDGAAPAGYHLIKSGAEKGLAYVKNRRMNWANPHALGRAERRIHSAVKHFTRYIRWVHPKREGHAAPKFKHHKGRKT